MIEIKGIEQHYDWGGEFYIPLLTGQEHASGEPMAELWLGDHPNGVATLTNGIPLTDWMAADYQGRLGDSCIKHYGKRLPFLLKVLDVKAPLSIQVHPTKKQAEKGYDLEQGLSIEPSKRNYKDANHKPELMLALSDFWLLHGFKSEKEITALLSKEQSLESLLSPFTEGGTKQLVSYIFALSASELAPLIMPIVNRYLDAYQENRLSKNNAYFWMMRAYMRAASANAQLEAGLLMVLLLNLCYVAKGGVIFQDAGIPHAYLEGQNIELMANSDNVLRAGLTSKHVDPKELLSIVNFDPVKAESISPIAKDGGLEYPVPVNDFCLTEYRLQAGESLSLPENPGPCIWFVLSGEMTVNGQDKYWRNGSAFYQEPGNTSTIYAQTELVIYRSSAKL
ncbi:mannose-6-phosphate isomerase, class I [Agarivorans aestuarii]|uniref:mannose-6-phosphate isomerase, class I n=1 Tax=Agarivorans aestuarii TaxID=1563703 RepID=UPI001C7E72B8|nr:mannose-6-phosphate isomerase, class I [Agarivorans aestuarii]